MQDGPLARLNAAAAHAKPRMLELDRDEVGLSPYCRPVIHGRLTPIYHTGKKPLSCLRSWHQPTIDGPEI